MKNTQTYSIFNSDQQASGNPPATGTPSSFFTQQVPQPSVPKGGVAIRSIDEKFTVNAVNGTSGAGIGLPFSPSRNGFAPALSLNYNSGGGNGIFGLGWNLGPGSITRKTDKQLPQYKDAEDSDTFLLSGAEDLVPLLIKDDRGNWTKDCISSGGISITRYRPRIESGFARIEKLTEAGGNVYWKITSGSNATGYIRMTDCSYSQKSFPPGEYTYRQAGWDTTVKTLPAASAENLPTGIDDTYQWLDLFNEGIPGIITEQAGNVYYKTNSGNGNFDGLQPIASKPTLTGLNAGSVQFRDIKANGSSIW